MIDLIKFLLFNRRLKKKMKQTHELNDPWSAELNRDTITELFQQEFEQLGTVLELGSGEGVVTEILKPYSDTITCVEIASEAIAKAQAKEALQDEKITFKESNIHTYLFSEHHDTTVLSFIVEYLGLKKFPKQFISLMMKIAMKTDRIVILQPIYGPEDMNTFSTITAIFKQFGMELKKDRVSTAVNPHIFFAIYEKESTNN